MTYIICIYTYIDIHIYNLAIKISIVNKLMSYNEGQTRSCCIRYRFEEVKAKFSVSKK